MVTREKPVSNVHCSHGGIQTGTERGGLCLHLAISWENSNSQGWYTSEIWRPENLYVTFTRFYNTEASGKSDMELRALRARIQWPKMNIHHFLWPNSDIIECQFCHVFYWLKPTQAHWDSSWGNTEPKSGFKECSKNFSRALKLLKSTYLWLLMWIFLYIFLYSCIIFVNCLFTVAHYYH